jgi:hypothetical protein
MVALMSVSVVGCGDDDDAAAADPARFCEIDTELDQLDDFTTASPDETHLLAPALRARRRSDLGIAVRARCVSGHAGHDERRDNDGADAGDCSADDEAPVAFPGLRCR